MHHVLNITILVDSSKLACSQSAGALNLGPSLLTLETTVKHELEEFNQQENFQKSTIERIDRKEHTLTMVAQKNPIDKVPLPIPKPRPAPIAPRF